MRYFILKQDERINNYASITDSIKEQWLWQSDEPFYCTYEVPAPHKHTYFLPLMTRPFIAVAENTKRIFDLYQTQIKYRPIGLGDKSLQSLKVYYFMRPPEIDCLSSNTEYYKNNSIKKLVLDHSKIGYDNVFTVKGVHENYLVVSLIVVEALLAKKINEINFVEVKCETD